MSIGLPQAEKNKLENIHFICCSNKVGSLSMAEPIVKELKRLESGVRMFDSMLMQEVLVLGARINL